MFATLFSVDSPVIPRDLILPKLLALAAFHCTPRGIRTPNHLIRSQVLCPLSYGRRLLGRVMGFEPTIFWATTRRVNRYTTPAMPEKCYHM